MSRKKKHSEFCGDCEADLALGPPSRSRWLGPDGNEYCSMHFINRFGHGERLVPKPDYVPPEEVKPPARKARKPRAKRATAKKPAVKKTTRVKA